jgi:hypothetical protein
MSDPKNPHGLVVGQRLWLVPHEQRHIAHARWVTITAVKRKWAELKGTQYRLDVQTLRLEPSGYGHGSEGVIWLSRDAWVTANRVAVGWDSLFSQMRDQRRPHQLVTEGMLVQATALLGLDVDLLFKGAQTFDAPG